MAHTLACLRFADLVTETVARLATGLDGLTLGRAGFAPAGRRTEISRGHRASSYPNRPAGPGRTELPIPRALLHRSGSGSVPALRRRRRGEGRAPGARVSDGRDSRPGQTWVADGGSLGFTALCDLGKGPNPNVATTGPLVERTEGSLSVQSLQGSGIDVKLQIQPDTLS